jgi:hypothetical protein
LGERYLATVCGSEGIKPQFLGKEVRGVRRHYAWAPTLSTHRPSRDK